MPVEVKELIDDYILLTYDLPAKEAKLRKKFLKQAYAAGAMMHCQSCYLMPYSGEMMKLAEELAVTGRAIVFRSKPMDNGQTKVITIKYHEHVQERCQLIEMRLVQINVHVELGELGRANRMIKKTRVLLDQLKAITETFNPPWLQTKLAGLEKVMSQVETEG